jgi:hypothetical protein
MSEMNEWNIRVQGITEQLPCIELHDRFEQFGDVFLVTLQQGGGSGGMSCLVQYKRQPDAYAAIRSIEYRFGWKATLERMPGIAVYNFKMDVTKEDVQEAFPNAADITIQPHCEGMRPVVWISFETKKEMEDAMQDTEEMFSERLRLMCVDRDLDKRRAFQELKEKQMKYQNKNTIYVIKMGKVNREQVVAAATEYGNVDSFVYIEPPGRPPYAIISYQTEEAYNRALNGGLILFRKKISVTEYAPR